MLVRKNAPHYAGPKINRIFILDEEHQKTGAALATLDWMQNPSQSTVQLFSRLHDRETQIFANMQAEDFKRVVMLGHANRTHYGDYTPKALAKQFAEQFALTRLDKSIEIGLDIIGCELGLIAENGQSYAQQLANELGKLGFTNLKIHAIASPALLSADKGMIVEVTAHAGSAALLGAHDGFITAYLLDSEEKAELDKAFAAQVPATVAIKNIIGHQPITFLHNANPSFILHRAENTFIPGEKPSIRLQRIMEDEDYRERQIQSEQKMMALKQINARLVQVKEKLHAATHPDSTFSKFKKTAHIGGITRLRKQIENLELLITAVEASDPEDWQATLKFNLQRFHTITMIRPKISTTYKLLLHLSELDITATEKHSPIIIPSHLAKNSFTTRKVEKKAEEKQENKRQEKQKDGLKYGSDFNIQEKSESTLPHLSEKEKRRIAMKQEHNRIGAKWLKDKKFEHRGDQYFQNALEEIDDLIVRLNNEIKQLSKGCFAFLNGYEIHTKTIKIQTLTNLKNTSADYDTLQSNAQVAKNMANSRTFNARKGNQNVHGQWVKNRTGVLIDRIIDGSQNFISTPPQQRRGKVN